MSDNEIHNHESEDVEGDAEGHVAGGGPGGPGGPGFVVDVPNLAQPGSDDDDAEGHLSGAVRVDPGLPSARTFGEDHPKSAEDAEAF